MKLGATSPIHKQNGILLNENHPHRHEAKISECIGVKERSCCKFFFTARTLSIMSSSLKVKLSIKKCMLTSLVALGMRTEGNVPTMENRQLISPSRQCFSTPIGFDQRFLNKEQCDNTGASPHSLMTWLSAKFYLFPRLKSALKGWSFCGATYIRNVTEELKRLLQNGFQKCFQHLSSHWKKCIVEQGDYFEVNVA